MNKVIVIVGLGLLTGASFVCGRIARKEYDRIKARNHTIEKFGNFDVHFNR